MKKRGIWSRVSLLLIMILFMNSIGGCGKSKKLETGNAADYSTFVYIPEYITLPTGDDIYISDFNTLGNELYFTVNESDWEVKESGQKIYCLNLEEENAKPQIYLDFSDLKKKVNYQYFIYRSLISEDGGMIRVEARYPSKPSEESAENWNQEVSFYLIKTDKDLNEVYSIEITSYLLMDAQNSYVQYAVEGKDGNLFLSNGCSYIWIFDRDGKHLRDIRMDSNTQNGGYINAFGVMDNGSTAYMQRTTNGPVLYAYEDAKMDFSRIYDNLPTDSFNTGITPCIQEGILLCGQSALYQYNPSTKTYIELVRWLDVNLTSEYVNLAFQLENGNIAAIYYDPNSNQSSVVVLRRTLPTEAELKEIITLGCMWFTQDLQKAVVNFNRTNQQYQIEVMNYSDNIDWNKETAYADYNAAIKQLQMDIATEKGPDLFLAVDVDMDLLAEKGAIEDLNPYLENSLVVNKSDFIEPVLNAYKVNGIQCAIPITFNIVTLTGRTSEVGEESGWTLDEMLAYANQYPDAELINNVSNSSVLCYCIMYDLDSFLNWKTGECNFNTDSFKKTLELAKLYPNDEDIVYDESQPESLRTHKSLLSSIRLTSPQDWQLMRNLFDEPITAIGYPTNESSGILVTSNDSLCINASSKNKEAAWSFIESFFTKEYSNNDIINAEGFFTQKLLYDSAMEYAMTPVYVRDPEGNVLMDEKGNPKEMLKDGWRYGDVIIECYSLSQEEVDSIWDIVNRIDGTTKYNAQLMNIIEEEAAPFFRNQKKIDEVIGIIQNRIQIYVNENK